MYTEITVVSWTRRGESNYMGHVTPDVEPSQHFDRISLPLPWILVIMWRWITYLHVYLDWKCHNQYVDVLNSVKILHLNAMYLPDKTIKFRTFLWQSIFKKKNTYAHTLPLNLLGFWFPHLISVLSPMWIHMEQCLYVCRNLGSQYFVALCCLLAA